MIGEKHGKLPLHYENDSLDNNRNLNFKLSNEKLFFLNSGEETPIKNFSFLDFVNLRVKDESVNRTGTHKDRMAHSFLAIYQHYYENNIKLAPSCSLISAGNAALAIGSLFQIYDLPKLKVLLDNSVTASVQNILQKNHCEIFKTNFSTKALATKEILELTGNADGVDITSFSLLDSSTKFYRSLVESVLQERPEFIIIPYGSGVLFEDFCSIIKENSINKAINLIGVTVNTAFTKADKLFSAYSPFDFNSDKLHFLKRFNYIGALSTIARIDDRYLENAMTSFKENNIVAEYSSVVTIAYMKQYAALIPKESSCIIVNTGKGHCSAY